MNGLRLTKVAKEIKFEGVWGKLESKKMFKRQTLTKYLRLTLVLISIFQEPFAKIDKTFLWQKHWVL